MTLFKKILFTFLTVILGLTFIVSAVTKLYPVELFELTLIDIGVANWFLAPVFARLLIGVEFFLGILLLLNFRLTRFTLKATIALLVLFTFYLIFLWITAGNEGNCKCFGDIFYMTPVQSIIKNLIMLGIAVAIYIWHAGFDFKWKKVIIILSVLIGFSLPFFLNPPDFIVSYRFNTDETGYKLDLDTLYTSTDIAKPTIELRKDRHIVAFMSLTCPHCRIAGYKLFLIKKQMPEASIFMVLNGKPKHLSEFFADTKATNIPYMMLKGERFATLGGFQLPAIYYIDDQIVVKKVNYLQLNVDEVKEFFTKK
jgi:hypothetical protein